MSDFVRSVVSTWPVGHQVLFGIVVWFGIPVAALIGFVAMSERRSVTK
jgi:hypothetical protein